VEPGLDRLFGDAEAGGSLCAAHLLHQEAKAVTGPDALDHLRVRKFQVREPGARASQRRFHGSSNRVATTTVPGFLENATGLVD
jgi:hypothetical protein